MPHASTPRDTAIVGLGLTTLAVGIPVDAAGAAWAQPAVSAVSWMALGAVLALADAAERRALVACVVLATLGELFLKDVWGLYEYRLGNLPHFIPAGHALVYATAARLSRVAPPALPPNQACSPSIASSSPKLHRVSVLARQAYSHSASVGRR